MSTHDVVQPVPSERTHSVNGDGTDRDGARSQRFSAKRKTEIVLRLLRGDDLDLLSREFRIPAARIATWREAFLEAGQDAVKKSPGGSRDREVTRLRQKLGESTMDNELLREKIARLETGRPLGPRRSRR
jgi:transposase-like protein